MSSKYQIFVSSTYNDLKDHRDLVIKAVLEMDHIPVGMEMFSAADEEQWSIIQRQIDQSDYYVLIMANRYGSVTQENISFTEKEYDYARAQGIPCLAFVLDSLAPWPSNFTDTERSQVLALNKFREKVKLKPVSFWKSNEDLYGKCSIALMKAFIAYPREGWIRASKYSDVKTTNELARLSAENAQLRSVVDAKNEVEEKEAIIRNAIRTLQANKRPLHIWKKNATAYELAKTTSLFELFHSLAPELIIENSVAYMSNFAALIVGDLKSGEYRTEFPVPSNSVKEWMVDFSTLGLVKPSSREKPVGDKDEYWTLTEQGVAALSLIRLVVLQQPMTSESEPGKTVEGAAPIVSQEAPA